MLDVEGRNDRRGGPILDAQPTTFFSRTYDEAIDLVEAARSYLSVLEPIDRRALPVPERLRLCSETMRMTARLTQIMAWLLSQRAVQAGEISRAEALEDQEALTEVDVCMAGDERDWRGLPQRLVALLDKSHRLYIRVARLDELARRSVN
jgi:regulator of CtrA degradation